MRRYLLLRMSTGALALTGVSLVIFLLIRVLPGDAAVAILAEKGQATPEEIASLRRELGTDRPLHEQYSTWVWGLMRLEMGKSFITGSPVFDEIKNRFPLTLELATLTVMVATFIAVPLGVVSAVYQRTWVDQILRVVSVAGLAMPTFWTGTLILLFLTLVFHWMPPIGYVSVFDDPAKNLQQIVWPAVALGYYLSAVVSRMTRSQMLEVLRQDYIRTAWAKGLRERVVVYRHALANAILPIVTIIGIQYAFLLGGTVVMESLFFLPGIGSALVNAIRSRDYPMVQTIIVIFSAIIIATNILVDVFYAVLDPRIRHA